MGLIAVATIIICAWRAPVAGAPVVRTEGGMVSGSAGSLPGMRVYKGIPYAAPPVGDLRWRAPHLAAAWKGTRDGSRFAPICPQKTDDRDSIYYLNPGPQIESEDCLYLNVWTGAHSASDRLPVLVWLYGGGFDHGSGTEKYYWGDDLAHKGAVVVTFNYRVGVLGFLAYPELTEESGHDASGNYGLMDQVAALRWVRRNIAAFGGDPERVTIFGQSAGGSSVALLTVSPLSVGLFQRAIAESGGLGQAGRKLADAESAGVAFAASVGARNLDDLRRLNVDQLRAVLGTGGPIVDGYVIPDDPAAIYRAGKQSDVPLIAGSTENEGGVRSINTTATAAEVIAHRLFAEEAEDYLRYYPAGSDAEAIASAYRQAAERTAAAQRNWARLKSANGKSSTYLYRFSRVPPFPPDAHFREGPLAQFGAYHSVELIYVFDHLYLKNWTWTDVDRRIADQMSSYWVNFAATGNPNGPGLPLWPGYDAQDQQLMNFAETTRAVPIPRQDALDFLDAHPLAGARSGVAGGGPNVVNR